MPTTLAQKLKIKPGFTLRTMHAPDGFEHRLDPVPDDVKFVTKGKIFDQLHWFVTNRLQLETELQQVLDLVQGDALCWVYYPKGSSKMQTDLSRDKGWESLQAHQDLQWISLISFDDTWSAFGFRRQSGTDKKKADKPAAPREIFNWVDPVRKEVRLPDDLAAAFKKHKAEAKTFEALSFTNKKEYLEWIVTAKREETRQERVSGTIEKLQKGWKNPRNT